MTLFSAVRLYLKFCYMFGCTNYYCYHEMWWI